MTDQSPTPQKSSSPADMHSVLSELLQSQYRCPHCNKVVAKLEGNQLKILSDHTVTSTVKDGSDEYILITLHHIHRPDIQPGH